MKNDRRTDNGQGIGSTGVLNTPPENKLVDKVAEVITRNKCSGATSEVAATEIVRMVGEMLPDIRLPNGTYSYDEIKGFNDCRNITLRRLGI